MRHILNQTKIEQKLKKKKIIFFDLPASIQQSHVIGGWGIV
jgi:hypothetical protein